MRQGSARAQERAEIPPPSGILDDGKALVVSHPFRKRFPAPRKHHAFVATRPQAARQQHRLFFATPPSLLSRGKRNP
jgi:hypothetical protein